MDRNSTAELRAELDVLRADVARLDEAVRDVARLAKSAPGARAVSSRGRGALKSDAIRLKTNALVGRLLREQRVEIETAATALSSEIGRPVTDVSEMIRDRQTEAMADGLNFSTSLEKAVRLVRGDVRSGRR